MPRGKKRLADLNTNTQPVEDEPEAETNGHDPDPAPAAPNVTPATILKHLRACMGAKEALDEATGEYRAALKAAKADGIESTDVTYVIRCKKKETSDVLASLNRRLRYLQIAGIPVGTQLDMFKDAIAVPKETAAEAQEWDADSEGFKAGKSGASTTTNRHRVGTRAHQAWTEGYLRGQAQIAGEMHAAN